MLLHWWGHDLLHYGGLLPSIRQSITAKLAAAALAERSAISAVLTELPADTKCQFSAMLPHIRHAWRRQICNFCNNCSIYCINRTNAHLLVELSDLSKVVS